VREASKNGRVIARFRVTSRAEGIQIEERSMTLEICIAINNEAGASHIHLLCRMPDVCIVDGVCMCVTHDKCCDIVSRWYLENIIFLEDYRDKISRFSYRPCAFDAFAVRAM